MHAESPRFATCRGRSSQLHVNKNFGQVHSSHRWQGLLDAWLVGLHYHAQPLAPIIWDSYIFLQSTWTDSCGIRCEFFHDLPIGIWGVANKIIKNTFSLRHLHHRYIENAKISIQLQATLIEVNLWWLPFKRMRSFSCNSRPLYNELPMQSAMNCMHMEA